MCGVCVYAFAVRAPRSMCGGDSWLWSRVYFGFSILTGLADSLRIRCGVLSLSLVAGWHASDWRAMCVYAIFRREKLNIFAQKFGWHMPSTHKRCCDAPAICLYNLFWKQNSTDGFVHAHTSTVNISKICGSGGGPTWMLFAGVFVHFSHTLPPASSQRIHCLRTWKRRN